MKKFIAVLIVLVSCVSFSACGETNDGGEKLTASAFNIVEKKCVAIKDDDYQQSVVSFYDDEYNYWIFDMGYLTDVPLEESHSYYKYTGGNIEYKFTTSVATTNSVKNTSERITSKSNTWSNTNTHQVDVRGGGGKKDVWNVTVEYGYTNSSTNGSYSGTSWSESFEKCETYTKTQESSVSINFDDSCEKGYYRYVLLGTINVYAAVIQDRNTKAYYANTYSEIKSYGYCLDFDKESALFDDYDDSLFEFDLSCLGELEEPTKYISIKKTDSALEDLVVFDKTIRTGNCKIAGSGKYTLDTFTLDKDISELSGSGYKKLNITISYALKEVDNCKQYISLYTSTDYVIKKETIEHGGSEKLTSWETYNMNCEIELEKLDSNIFNFKCQAQNALFKDFYIGQVSVKIIAVE